MFLSSPFQMLQRLFELAITLPFWISIMNSFIHITAGFMAGTILAVFAGILSSRYNWIASLLAPLVLTIKTIPVVSFIILAIFWVSSSNLAFLISLLMVFPIIYTSIFNGIKETDSQLLEMAKLFRTSTYRKIRYIYIPQVFPFFYSGISIALGLCWKSGVAAEVIGMPTNTIGEGLQQAKIYINTPDLFAWTFVIILISLLFEKLFCYFLKVLLHLLER
ncbi:MAG: ABC transporter permease subunit [Lachnospiraceae bacterium]